MWYEMVILALFPGAMAYAALTDMFTMKIPNTVSLVLLAGFLILAGLSAIGWQTFGWHLLAGFAMLVVGFILFAVGGVGGGDAKLFAAVSLWLGFEHLFQFMLVMTLIGGLLSIILLMLRRMPVPSLLQQESWLMRLHSGDRVMPYGIAIGAAGMIVYPETHWVLALV